MSFWRTFGFHTVSAIDTILDKEDYTLEELLDEEEILQEVKSQNKRLLDFLTQPNILKVLIEFITVEPADGEEESKRKYKYPFLACEILCSDVWTICDAVYKDEELVHGLYSFLEQDAPLNHQLANYVCRAAGVLLQRKITETVEYMKSHDMIRHFIKHLNNASVMDLLLKVISCEETSEGSGILDWLCETDLIPCLVSKFSADNPPDVHENAAQALVDIISVSGGVASSPLIRQLESEPIVKTLFDAILAKPAPQSALLHGLTVAIELLARSAAEAQQDGFDMQFEQTEVLGTNLPPPIAPSAVPPAVDEPAADDADADANDDKADSESAAKTDDGDDKTADDDTNTDNNNSSNSDEKKAKSETADDNDDEKSSGKADDDANADTANDNDATDDESLPPLLAQTLARLEPFANLLTAEATASRVMSSGEKLDSFGFEKLKILEFFAMVVRLNCRPIDAELQRLDFFSHALDAFFKYTWNNFLHATVEQIIGGVLDGDNAALQHSLLARTKLPARLVAADAANDAEMAKPRGVRRGYMGHVTSIAVRLQQAATRSNALAVALDNDAVWAEYVAGPLAATRAAETKPLGGHRPMGGPGDSSDDDEEELDDDGDSIFDRYQLGFGPEEFGDDDADGDIHFDDGDYDHDGEHGDGFEMYEDGSDDSADGDWPHGDEVGAQADDADDVAAVVADVEAAVLADEQAAAAAVNSNDDDDDDDANADAEDANADADAAAGDEASGDEPAAADAKPTDATDANADDEKKDADAAKSDGDDDDKAEEKKSDEPIDTDKKSYADAAAGATDAAKKDDDTDAAAGDDDDDDLLEAFKALDTDNSGKLSRDEISKVMANMDQFDTPEKIEAALKKIDADGDGQIDYDEFAKLVESGAD